MEINFGLSGLLRGTGGQKDKNKPSKKKINSSSSTSTLPRRWSFKLPKLVERKEERESGGRNNNPAGHQVFVAKLSEANNKSVKTGKAPPPPPPRRPALADLKERAWVSKIMLNEREHSQSGRQTKSPTRNNLAEVEEEEEKDSALLRSSEGDLINVEIKELYSSPMLDVTMPGFYSDTQSQPFQEQEFYENSENSESTVATVESFVDDGGQDSCSFEDIDTIMDTITENVNEMDLYDNIGAKDDEMDSDDTKDDNSSKTSSDDIIITFNDQPKLKGKGSILKHPGQKKRHIKHVEFLDLICDDQGNSDSVRYF